MLGMVTVICASGMTFAAMVAAMMFRRSLNDDWHTLPVPRILWWNTIALVLSSIAIDVGRRFLRDNRRTLFNWYWGTGCLLGTLLTEPEKPEILKQFYKTVRPWGCWGPIREQVLREDPTFQPNRDMARDSVNVAVGIVWQLCLTALPIYLVLRNWTWVAVIGVTLVVTSVFIKFNWYDRLEKA